MPKDNLSPGRVPGKARRTLGAGLTVLALLLALGCNSNDNPLADSLPSSFTLAGTYYLVQRASTSDGINFSYDSESSTGGVMLVEPEDTLVSNTYDLYAYPFNRDYTFDGGTTTLADSGYVLRSDRMLGLLYKDATEYAYIGSYDEDDDWIKINYTTDDLLYTETWKRVKPVTDVPNSDGGIPWVP